jgi:hypothetical protein
MTITSYESKKSYNRIKTNHYLLNKLNTFLLLLLNKELGKCDVKMSLIRFIIKTMYQI